METNIHHMKQNSFEILWTETATRGGLKKKCFKNGSNIHRKTPADLQYY